MKTATYQPLAALRDSAKDVMVPVELGPFGQYELLEILGAGGMGTVYKALHPSLQKTVAIKVMTTPRADDPAAVARFQREMIAVGKLEHPNIVGAHDGGEIDGRHFLVMEYLEGIDLSRLVQQHGPLEINDACDIICQAAEGLQHACNQGIIHRDLKPSNLMLTLEGQVKILDMGLALLDETAPGEKTGLTANDQLMGTLDYMAPEQARDSHKVDIRSDIYSLGATLYKLLCGKAPFADSSHDSVMKTIWALATEKVEPIRDKRPEVPEELAGVVERMLAKNPEERFATPAEVIEALEPFASPRTPSRGIEQSAENREVAGEPGVRLSPHPVKTKARPLWGALSVTALVACILVASVFTYRVVTDKGTVVIQSYDPNIEVTVIRHGKSIDGFRIRQRPDGVSYSSGTYGILIKGGKPDGVTIENEQFSLTRGETVIVRITREQKDDRSPSKLQRDVVEWALQQGGTSKVHISLDNGIGRTITDKAELPTANFQVVAIFLGPTRNFDPSGLKQLRQLPTLKLLHFVGTPVMDVHLEVIRDCESLMSLTLYNTQVKGDGLRHLAGMKNLQAINFRETELDPSTLVHLKKIEKLTYLGLAVQLLSDQELEHVGRLKNLTELEIWSCSKTTANPVPKKITNRGLGHLSSLTRLETLELHAHVSVTDEGLIHLSAMPSLTKLVLPGCNVTGTGLKHLECTESLRELDLGAGRLHDVPWIWPSTVVNDAGMAEIARFKNLTILDIDSEFVTNNGVQHLASLSKLQTLEVACPQITDEGARHLHGLKNLKQLDVAKTKITPAGIAALQKALPDCKKIKGP